MIVDFLDALAQSVVGVVGLAALNHYSGGDDWTRAWMFGSIFMFCFWLGRFSAERLSRRKRSRSGAAGR
jgi:hypothetical protein